MSEKKCFFIGHRETSADILPLLRSAIERHIVEYGVTEFMVGNYGAFDHFAAQCVIEAKKIYPDVILSMLLPYYPTEHAFELPEGFDGSFYPAGQESVPRRFAIVRANKYAVDHTDYLSDCALLAYRQQYADVGGICAKTSDKEATASYALVSPSIANAPPACRRGVCPLTSVNQPISSYTNSR